MVGHNQRRVRIEAERHGTASEGSTDVAVQSSQQKSALWMVLMQKYAWGNMSA